VLGLFHTAKSSRGVRSWGVLGASK